MQTYIAASRVRESNRPRMEQSHWVETLCSGTVTYVTGKDRGKMVGPVGLEPTTDRL